jgi:lysozyme
VPAAWQTIEDAVRSHGAYTGEPSPGQTTGGTHSTNSKHYTAYHGGHALDMGQSDGDPGACFRLLEPLARSGAIIELFYDPMGGYKNGRRTGPIGGHRYHCHAAVAPGREGEVAALARTFRPGERTIREGSRGPDVEAWQRHLRATPDGIFGPGTKAATVDYQRARSLTADGVVGPQTWAAGHRDRSPSAPPPPPPMAGRIGRGAKGIDVSHHQEPIDWGAVARAGYTFAIVRASYGATASDLDRRYPEHRDGARRAGLALGHYHYAYPGAGDAVAEAEHFLRVMGPVPAGELVVLDLETGTGDLSRWALDFLAVVEKAAGRLPVVYGYPAFLEAQAMDPALARFPLWVAHYDVAAPRIPRPWSAAVLWQQTSSGQAPGVTGPCDVNTALDAVPAECFGGAVPIPTPPTTHKEDRPMIWHAYGGWYWCLGGKLSHIANGAEPPSVKSARAQDVPVIEGITDQEFRNRLVAGTEARTDLAERIVAASRPEG